ncbi:MAG: methyltransferase domain-containing protein [Candidatus Solibacter sp.]
MDVTNRFVLDFARAYAQRRPGAAMLDFGCGAGAVVAAARAAGLNMVGSDVFYAGSQDRARAAEAGLLGTAIIESQGGRLAFPDASFDLVTNNQVLEHVPDLAATLGELDRVLKPGGTLLSLFPSRDVLREGHIGIPLAHRFPKNSRSRFLYTWALRSVGLGTWKEQAPTCRQWAVDKLGWIDSYTFYRSRREIWRAFDAHFQSELREADYIRYRLRDEAWRAPLAHLLELAPLRSVAAALFRKLAFLVVVSRKAL